MNKTVTAFFISCLFIFFISVSNSRAQLPNAKPQFFSWGIKGGLTFAQHVESVPITDFRQGFLVGAFTNFNLPALPLSIQPELLYVQKGTERFTTDFEIDYLEIPILAKLYVTSTGSLDLNLFAGPYVGIVLNAKEISRTNSFNRTDEVNTDFGGITGFSLDMHSGGIVLFVEGRFGLGFTKVFNGSNVKNSVFYTNAGVRF